MTTRACAYVCSECECAYRGMCMYLMKFMCVFMCTFYVFACLCVFIFSRNKMSGYGNVCCDKRIHNIDLWKVYLCEFRNYFVTKNVLLVLNF